MFFLVKEENINIGISWPFTDILDFKKHFYQAVVSIKQAQNFGKTNKVLVYTDYSFYDLLFNYTDKIPLKNYCHPALQILKEYDNSNKSELVLCQIKFKYRYWQKELFLIWCIWRNFY